MRDIKIIFNINDYTDFSDCVTKDMWVMQSKCYRNAALVALVGLIKKYVGEIKAEKCKANPNARFIAARKQKISEMRQTLKSAQR